MQATSVRKGARQLLGPSAGSMALRGLVAAAVALALGGMGAPAVLAQEYPLTSGSASMEDIRLAPGGSTTILGRGWLPGSTVTATLLPEPPDRGGVAAQSEPRTLARTEVDADGTFTMDVEIPEDLAPGKYLLQVTGTDEDGEPTRVEMTFTVEADDEEPADGEPVDEGPVDEGEPVDEGPVDEGEPADEGPADEGPSADGEAPAREGGPAGDGETPAGSEEPPADEGQPGASSLAVTGLGLLGGLMLAAVLVAAGWGLLRVTRNRRTRIDV